MQPLWSASVVGMQGGGTPIIDVCHGYAGKGRGGLSRSADLKIE